MADSDDPVPHEAAAEADRLALALDRIARLSTQRHRAEPARAAPAEVTARLDALIAQIRRVLQKTAE